MTKTALYFLHGWGFSADFWSELTPYFETKNYPVFTADAGYFGRINLNFPQEKYVAIGHSLGFMQLLEKSPKMSDCLGFIGINAFACFVQQNNFSHGIPPRILARMQRNLRKNPVSVLNDFYKTCGTETTINADQVLDLEQLERGLEHLATGDGRSAFHSLKQHDRILGLLSGENDPLAPAQIKWMETQTKIKGGHLLPLTDPEFCAKWIEHHLNGYKDSYENPDKPNQKQFFQS